MWDGCRVYTIQTRAPPGVLHAPLPEERFLYVCIGKMRDPPCKAAAPDGMHNGQ
jgi:hypothetical protein